MTSGGWVKVCKAVGSLTTAPRTQGVFNPDERLRGLDSADRAVGKAAYPTKRLKSWCFCFRQRRWFR